LIDPVLILVQNGSEKKLKIFQFSWSFGTTLDHLITLLILN